MVLHHFDISNEDQRPLVLQKDINQVQQSLHHRDMGRNHIQHSIHDRILLGPATALPANERILGRLQPNMVLEASWSALWEGEHRASFVRCLLSHRRLLQRSAADHGYRKPEPLAAAKVQLIRFVLAGLPHCGCRHCQDGPHVADDERDLRFHLGPVGDVDMGSRRTSCRHSGCECTCIETVFAEIRA